MACNAYISMHMCFGQLPCLGRGNRSLLPAVSPPRQGPGSTSLRLNLPAASSPRSSCSRQLPETMDVAVGLVDVKNTWIEPAKSWSPMPVDLVLKYVEGGRGSRSLPDCGFSQTARHVAAAKAKAMVEGIRMVRREIHKLNFFF